MVPPEKDNRRAPRSGDRAACYDRIRSCMEQHLRDYYRTHPERLLDRRSMEKVEMMRQTLTCILEILDSYDITMTPGWTKDRKL